MELVFEVHKMQGYEYFITIHFISLSILHLPICCLCIYWFTVHQEYLILNRNCGLGRQPLPVEWTILQSNNRWVLLSGFFPPFFIFFSIHKYLTARLPHWEGFQRVHHNYADLQDPQIRSQTSLPWTPATYLNFASTPHCIRLRLK